MKKNLLLVTALTSLILSGCTIPGLIPAGGGGHSSQSSDPTSESSVEPTSEQSSEVTSEPTSEITSVPTSETSVPTSVTSEVTSEITSESTSIITSESTSEITLIPTSVPTTSVPTSQTSSVPVETKSVEKSAATIVEENDFTISEKTDVHVYERFNLNEDIEVSTSGKPNCGSFWWQPETQWRLYQKQNGDVTIAAKNGYSIQTVKLSFVNQYGGLLLNSQGVVASDAVVSVNAPSITFTVGNSSSEQTSGQIRITNFAVTYSTSSGGGSSSSSAPTSSSVPTSSSSPTSTPSSTPSGDKAKHTILVYMCGSDLESGYASQNKGLASSDLLEMLSVSNQPDDVNIVIETGGASKWSKNPGVSASYLQRYHIKGGKMVLDVNLTKANMGLSSTLRSFITWGLETYPAEKTGLVFWNHGGGPAGACFDENYSDDSLVASEMASAYKGAFATAGVDKLEWVGYDCCIMSYADLATVNSQYFNYMVSSQELESGYGWDYDAWLPTLFKNSSVDTPTLLTKICDTFVEENGGTSTNNDQCLSVLDLSKMSEFITSFDTTFAGSLTSSDWSKLKSTYTSSLRFANISDYGTAYGYGLCDMKDFLTKANSSYLYSTKSALTALESVVIHSSYGGYYKSTKPCGLNVFIPADSSSNAQVSKSEYGASDTLLTNWRNFVIANGTFYSGGGWY